MRGTVVWIAMGLIGALGVVLLAPSEASAQCDPGWELVGEDADNYFCSPSETFLRIENDICVLDSKIDDTRQRIEDYRQRLPGYFEALDEWRASSDEAVRQALRESFNLGLSGLLRLGADRAGNTAGEVTDRMRIVGDMWTKEVLSNGVLQRALGGRMIELHEAAKRWTSLRDMYLSVNAMHRGLQLANVLESDAGDVEKVIKGTINTLGIVVSLPTFAERLSAGGELLKPVALANFGINYAYAATRYATGWARINQLRDTTLHAEATALQDIYKRQIQEKKARLKEFKALAGEAAEAICDEVSG